MSSCIKQWYTYRYRQLTHSASVYWFRFCLRCVVQCSSYVEQSEWYRWGEVYYIRVWTKSYVMLLVWMSESECVRECIKYLAWCIVYACECARVFVYSSRMLGCVRVWFLCLVVTHFFDNAHFALEHVLVDFLLSKIISFGSVAFVSILRSCVLLSYLFWQYWPLNLWLVYFVIVYSYIPYSALEKFYYCHQF